MIRSKLGRLWRFLKEEVIPLIFGLLVYLSFLFFALSVVYCLCRGWIILFTGDIDFLPPLSAFLKVV